MSRASILIVASLLLAGCTAGPDYIRPSLPVAPAWRNAPAVPRPDDAAWWKSLHDPLLDRLEEEALSANLDIEQALARVQQSRAALKAAHAAQLPSGGIDGTIARERQSINQGLGRLTTYVPGLVRTQDEAMLSTSLGWDLDLAGGLRRAREAAIADTASAEASAAAARLIVAADVADAYVMLRSDQAQQNLLRQRRELLNERRKIMAVRIAVGQEPRRALDEMDADLAALDAALPALRAAVEADRARLAVLLGRLPSQPWPELDASGTIPVAPDVIAGTPADLLRQRPDIAVAEAKLIAANARVGVAIAQYYPSISISGLLGFATNSLSSLFTDGSSVIQGAAGLGWRLFDFNRIDADVAAAQGIAREATAAYRQAVLRAAQDVETGFARLLAARDARSAKAAQENARAAALQSTRSTFTVGQVSRDQVLREQSALLQAQAERFAADADLTRTVILCHRALGS